MIALIDAIALISSMTFWFTPFLFIWAAGEIMHPKENKNQMMTKIIAGICLMLFIAPSISNSMHL